MVQISKALIVVLFLFGVTTTLLGQIYMDGDSSDWDQYPLLIDAPNNEADMFPSDAWRIAVTDIVDIKKVKATIIENVLYGYIEFWGGPAWPNYAYENDHEGSLYYESRGYYRLLLDLDNDATTGWSSDWYEAQQTSLGYLISEGNTNYEPIGTELLIEWGARTNDPWKIANEAANPVRTLAYWGADFEEMDGKRTYGGGVDYAVFELEIPNADTTKIMQWEGLLKIEKSDDDLLLNDSLSTYWMGHAWGDTFIEFGIELTPFQKYFMHKDGRSVLQPGDVIGVCGMTETPIDDWGVDMTTRGEISIVVDVHDNEPALIEDFNLSQNYPNPFNPSTTIKYQIPNDGMVSLKIYDITGKEVATLVNKVQTKGRYEINFDASNLSSGIYFCKINSSASTGSATSFTKTIKMLLLK